MTNIRNVALSIAPDKVLSNLSSDLSTFNYGTLITLSGLFTLADKQPIASLPVKLEVKSTDELNWREVSTLNTGIDGKVSVQIYLGQNQSLRLRSDGTWERLEGLSNIQNITVRPQIKILAPSSAIAKSAVNISGVVTPGKNTKVSLERFDTKWVTVATTVTDESGNYQFQYSVGNGPFIKLRTTSAGGESVPLTIAIR
jgi:5-hydroxyisourate hydrolase-like protein (transthyretin family)